MSDTSDNIKYKWTPESTSLLVSVWSDKQVQKQFEYAHKPQLIWESVSRYMRKKGYEVTGRQCKSRMKQVLVCYKEAKKSGTHDGVERYYESIDKVVESKKMEKNNFRDNGIDTVDSVKIFKSPPKEVKTNANLQMQNKYGNAKIQPMKDIEVHPLRWQNDHEEYGDSSESNETVVLRPHRPLSPMRNVATNTIADSIPLEKRSARRSLPEDERFRYDYMETNRFSEVPLKNSVQNVQNQIIQENMMLRNQYVHDNGVLHHNDYQVNMNNPNIRGNYIPESMPYHPNRITTNMARIQSQLQQYSINPNLAMPQQPRKLRNLQDNMEINTNFRVFPRNYVDHYAPDIGPNLNDAFCQTTKNNKVHNLNETYDQEMFIENEVADRQIDATTITNNATFNDDTISIEFINDSPSPTENETPACKNNSFDNSMCAPNAPARLKKIQKLEQLMLNAITSQTEVVNKILAAQDVMVSKIIDFDKDRRSNLETRLDQLMNVVQQTVVNNKPDNNVKRTEEDGIAPLLSPIKYPTCFSPPPKPGAQPPKLDLVPPKPCRVPCTSPSGIELINQNPVQTRPGVIAPPKPGRIWEKLGPVSQSPFVKAQQQITAVTKAAEHWRTKSSAERRIAQQCVEINFDSRTMMMECEKFLESEKLIEERIENARRMLMPEKDNSARRKLFDLAPAKEEKVASVEQEKTPSAAVVLTKAFLDIERQAEEKSRAALTRFDNNCDESDDLLTGHGESYERLKRLSFRKKPRNVDDGFQGKLDTSTPAKYIVNNNNNNNNNNKLNPAVQLVDYGLETRQTIQQLADLVMQSARWRNDAINSNHPPKLSVNFAEANPHEQMPVRPPRDADAQRQSINKARDWLQDRYIQGVSQINQQLPNEMITTQNYPIGFSTTNLNLRNENDQNPYIQQIRFANDVANKYGQINNRDFLENERRNVNGNRQIEKINRADKGPDDDDDEFLDTTTTFQPYRKTSLTSTSNSAKGGCIVS